MRRDLRPYRLHRFQSLVASWWVDHFIKPQLDACGEGLQVIGPRHFHISGPNIKMGRHVHAMALTEAPVRLSVFESMGEITIGDFTLLNPGVRITSARAIKVGKKCMLAMNSSICDADWHDVQHRIFAPGRAGEVMLEDNVWLGEGARVLKGVTIGENTIVGAGSVVASSLPADVIAAGNPVRVIKSLDSKERTVREALFGMEVPYQQFADELMRQRLGRNTWLGWLSSLLFPSQKD